MFLFESRTGGGKKILLATSELPVTRPQSGASANVKLVHRRSMVDTCVVDFSSLLLIPVRQTHRAESSAICKQ